MYLQLAENGENYTPIETNQGTIYVRNDLAEETLLAAGGKGLQIASKVVGKVGPNIPIPGAAKAAQVTSKILNKAAVIQQKSGIEPSKLKIGQKIKAAVSKLKKKGAPEETTALPEAIAARTAAEEVAPKESFFKKYRTPLLIGGGVIVLGTAAYLLTRKKRK